MAFPHSSHSILRLLPADLDILTLQYRPRSYVNMGGLALHSDSERPRSVRHDQTYQFQGFSLHEAP